MAEQKVLSVRYDVPEAWKLDVAMKHGVYDVARKVVGKMDPAQIKSEMKAANIRGRGGAGFPAGMKWGFCNKVEGKPIYLVVNADEGEPGTFKDITIMEKDPHRFLEGCMIAMWAIGANVGYLYVRGEMYRAIQRLEDAIGEARAKGILGRRVFGTDFDCEIHVHPGAGAYICGEETALLNSLEGKRGEPRLKPPFPAVEGAFGAPTLVNNVETIWAVPTILDMGGAAFQNLSRLPNDGGTRLYGISGHCKRNGIFEGPVGLTLRELIEGDDYGRGMLDRPLKGVIPGGSSTPVVNPDDVVKAPDPKHPLHAWNGKSHIDVPMGVDTFRALGTMLGTCGLIVMDTSVNMVEAARNLMKFYKHESCGQCTPCREGTGWLVEVLDALVEGRGKQSDVDLLVDISNNMMGTTICALADGTAMPMLGFIYKYKEEFLDAVKRGTGGVRLDAATAALLGARRKVAA